MSANKNIFASRLEKLIKYNNYTHNDIASGIDVTRQAVGKWVKGDSIPDVLTAGKLAAFLDVSVDYLAGISPYKTQNKGLSAACNYTGLSEEAVENIKIRTSTPAPHYGESNTSLNEFNGTIYSAQYYDTNKKILNALLSCSWFWNIVFEYMIMTSLQEQTFDLQEEYNKAWKLVFEQTNFPDLDSVGAIVEMNKRYNDIDVARYAVTKAIEKISDLFDCRVQKGGSDNGKHNPKKE